MKINPAFAAQAAKGAFERDGMVAIENFLDPANAEEIRRFLSDDMPVDWWRAAISPHPTPGHEYLSFPLTEAGRSQAAQEKARLSAKFFAGEFCYSFKRSMSDHYESCWCPQCKYQAFFGSQEVLACVNEVTGAGVSRSDAIFSSWYDEGDFLCIHTDVGLGKLAFVLNLAKDWRFVYGGNLVLFEDDIRTPKKVFVPAFNTLVLFRIPDGGVPHCVTHVAPGASHAKGKRLAISGWYK